MLNTTLLLLPPLINVLVTGIFAFVILRQYVQRRRNYQLYWTIALCLAFIATLAYMSMIIVGPTTIAGTYLFRLYYAFGGTIMPSWLGLGSIGLLGKPRMTRICAGFLMLLSTIACIFVLDASIDMVKLSQIAGEPGTGTLIAGPWLIMTIVLNTLGVVAVAGVALYSGWQLLRKQASMGGLKTSRVLWANIFIFAGAILNAVAGSLARILGLDSIFWLIMAIGWIVLFVGVILASRRSSVAPPTPANQNIQKKQLNQIIVWGNICILIGALLNAAASSLAHFLGIDTGFWVFIPIGWIILLIGLLLTNRSSNRTNVNTHIATTKTTTTTTTTTTVTTVTNQVPADQTSTNQTPVNQDTQIETHKADIV